MNSSLTVPDSSLIILQGSFSLFHAIMLIIASSSLISFLQVNWEYRIRYNNMLLFLHVLAILLDVCILLNTNIPNTGNILFPAINILQFSYMVSNLVVDIESLLFIKLLIGWLNNANLAIAQTILFIAACVTCSGTLLRTAYFEYGSSQAFQQEIYDYGNNSWFAVNIAYGIIKTFFISRKMKQYMATAEYQRIKSYQARQDVEEIVRKQLLFAVALGYPFVVNQVANFLSTQNRGTPFGDLLAQQSLYAVLSVFSLQVYLYVPLSNLLKKLRLGKKKKQIAKSDSVAKSILKKNSEAPEQDAVCIALDLPDKPPTPRKVDFKEDIVVIGEEEEQKKKSCIIL
ncbi:hypothetical protein HDV06_002504 [Boothiomyces sp. JEL0866]|nr:hypothetical protein HDV06_002504 [Boothiomyces sp. JEL0866]